VRDAGGEATLGADPITLMKARKNAAEIRGSRAAHLRDGAAMVNFLSWFAEEAPKGRMTEIDAVKALESFRRATGKLVEVSFPTISGAGPNGAIVHYRVTERTNRKIGKGLFLLDSGAQFEDGTTDITRTIAVGKPNAEMRDRFTRVLKGHIAIARAVFPKGATGGQIDAFARRDRDQLVGEMRPRRRQVQIAGEEQPPRFATANAAAHPFAAHCERRAATELEARDHQVPARRRASRYHSTTARQPMHHDRRAPPPPMPPNSITAAMRITCHVAHALPAVARSNRWLCRNGAAWPWRASGNANTIRASTA
jgi:hypothetical protein